MSEKIKFITDSINQIQNNEDKHFFIVPDAEGRALASVQYIYDLALAVSKNGKETYMLFLDDKSPDPVNWMGDEYKELQRISFKDMVGKLTLRACDFIYIPEVFTELMQSFHKDKVSSNIIVVAQNYDYCHNNMVLGESWLAYNIREVIVNSNSMAAFVERYVGKYNTTIIYPRIEKTTVQKVRNPYIGIYGRNQKLIENTIKMFYQAYPQYKWIPFIPISEPTKKQFLEVISKCSFVMWYDQSASFGTFPLEAMACGVPVVGVRPDILPDWMVEEFDGDMRLAENGYWIDSIKNMPPMLAEMIERYLIDVPYTTTEKGFQTAAKYETINYSDLEKITQRRLDLLKQILEIENGQK